MTHQAPCPQQRGSFHGFPTRDTGMAKMSFFCLFGPRIRHIPGAEEGSGLRPEHGIGSAGFIVPLNDGEKCGGQLCIETKASTGLW